MISNRGNTNPYSMMYFGATAAIEKTSNRLTGLTANLANNSEVLACLEEIRIEYPIFAIQDPIYRLAWATGLTTVATYSSAGRLSNTQPSQAQTEPISEPVQPVNLSTDEADLLKSAGF